MQMVAVEGIGVGADHDLEAAAGGLVDGAQEAADVLVLAVPAVEHLDAAPVGEDEGGYVDGIGAAIRRGAGLGARESRIVLRLSMLVAPQELQTCRSGKLDGTRSQLVILKGCLQEEQKKYGMRPNA